MAETYQLMEVLRTRILDEALDELEREFNVRSRCFLRWIAEGRMSKTDAQDRLDRLFSAIEHLKAFQKTVSKTQNKVSASAPSTVP